jgi:hypothetical protein
MDVEEQGGSVVDGHCGMEVESVAEMVEAPLSMDSPSSQSLFEQWGVQFSQHMWEEEQGKAMKVHEEAWDQIFLMSVLCRWTADETMRRRIREMVQRFCKTPVSPRRSLTVAEVVVRREQDGMERVIPPSSYLLQDVEAPILSNIFLRVQNTDRASIAWRELLHSIKGSGTSKVIEALNQLQSVSHSTSPNYCCNATPSHPSLPSPLIFCLLYHVLIAR